MIMIIIIFIQNYVIWQKIMLKMDKKNAKILALSAKTEN